jgi:hypothetical protein
MHESPNLHRARDIHKPQGSFTSAFRVRINVRFLGEDFLGEDIDIRFLGEDIVKVETCD